MVLPWVDILRLVAVNHGGGGRIRGLASFDGSDWQRGISVMSIWGRSRFFVFSGFAWTELFVGEI